MPQGHRLPGVDLDAALGEHLPRQMGEGEVHVFAAHQQVVADGVVAAADVRTTPENDATLQQQQLSDMILEGYDAIVINAAKIKLTGLKLDQKVYLRHTGYMSGQRSTPMKKLMETRPEEVIIRAVKGMLPKNPLGRAMYRKLKIYSGPEHQHSAQQPKALEI